MSPSPNPNPNPKPKQSGTDAASGAIGLPLACEREWEPRMLVVDDDPVCRIASVALLERLGLVVDVAEDGPEAVRMNAAWPYVAIFMDCYMPEIDGFRATREIRTLEGLAHSPIVIAVTSRPRHVCLASGMDHHISKPLRLERLTTDARLLGLTPVAAVEVPASELPAGLGAAPLLTARPGLSEERTAVLGAGVIRRLLLALPRLWRAVNATDTGRAQRIGEELKQHATGVGAIRLAEVAAALADAAERCRMDQVVALELELRRVLRQTAQAVRLVLEPPVRLPEPAAMPTEVPAALVGAGLASGTAGVALRVPAAPGVPGVSATSGVSAVSAVPTRTARVVVADDDPLARLAVEAMVRGDEGLELVGSAADVAGIVALVAEQRPDVAVLDFMMPGGGGPEAARRIAACSPGTRVIAMTATDSPDAYLAMLRAGASGLLVKGGPAAKLVAMIHRAAGSSSPA